MEAVALFVGLTLFVVGFIVGFVITDITKWNRQDYMSKINKKF